MLAAGPSALHFSEEWGQGSQPFLAASQPDRVLITNLRFPADAGSRHT